MNRAMAMVLGLLVMAGPAQAGRDVLREQSSRTVDPSGLRGVRIENRHGDVHATLSPDGRVHVTAFKTVRSGSPEDSRKLARELGVEIQTIAGELAVKVRYPSHRSIRIGFWDLFTDFEVPSADVRVEVQVPRGLPLTVRSTSGDIVTEGVASDQQLDATSGDIEVLDAAAPVRATTTSGDVELRGAIRARVRTGSGDAKLSAVRGPLDAHTSSGDLTVTSAGDSLVLGTVTGDLTVHGASRGLSASTTSGEIEATDIRGAVEVSASSGSVQIELVATDGGRISTGSGDIVLTLGRGRGARIELQTSNGSLQMDAPISVVQLSRRRVVGQWKQGGPDVVLRSASGDIHVKTGERES